MLCSLVCSYGIIYNWRKLTEGWVRLTKTERIWNYELLTGMPVDILASIFMIWFIDVLLWNSSLSRILNLLVKICLQVAFIEGIHFLPELTNNLLPVSVVSHWHCWLMVHSQVLRVFHLEVWIEDVTIQVGMPILLIVLIWI